MLVEKALENHRKPPGYKKETFEKGVDVVKANGSFTVPRLQEPNSEKLGTAGLIRKMTFSTTKDLDAIVYAMDQGEAQRKATDLAITIKTWNPESELIKSRDFRTHDFDVCD